jgi:DNA-binding NarL/FixJ family response regulator
MPRTHCAKRPSICKPSLKATTRSHRTRLLRTIAHSTTRVMSLQDKLDQLRNLLAQRDEIGRQLDAMVGHYGSQSAEPEAKSLPHRYAPKTTPGHERKNKKGVPNKDRCDGDDAGRNESIMRALNKGEKLGKIAKEFGVSPSTVLPNQVQVKSRLRKSATRHPRSPGETAGTPGCQAAGRRRIRRAARCDA